MASKRLIMECMEDVMYFILLDTSSENTVWSKIEQITLEPCMGGTFPNNFIVLFIIKVFGKPLCS